MDLRQLRNLVAILETGSISKAAERLHISQPALSKSIQRLEAELDVPLFDREARGVQPTLYAENLRHFAQAAALGMAQAVADLQALKNGTEGIVSLAAPQAIADEIFGRCAARIVRERPTLQIRLAITATALFSDLLAGKYDLVVAAFYAEIPEADLDREFLFDDRFVAIVRPGHALAGKSDVTPQNLATHPWIFGPVGTLHRRRLEQFFNAAGVGLPRPSIECRGAEVIKSIVMQTDHVALMSRLGAAAAIRNGQLAAIELDSPFLNRPIGMLWRKGRLTPAVEFAIATIRTLCREAIHVD